MDEDEFLEVTEDSDGRDSEGSESDGDDLGIAMDTESSSKKRDAEEYLFEVLTPERIMLHMCEIIRDVNNVLQLPTTVVRILLNHYKWDREKLMETYYSDDPEKIFTDAHIISPFGAQKLGSKASSSSAAANVPSIRYPTRQSSKPSSSPTIMSLDASGDEECQICLNRCPSCNMTGLECSHRFCSKCWAEYLTTKVMDDGMGQTISCAAHNCGILVDDATAMKLLKDNKVKLRYQHLITNNFVESNRLMRWCPSPDCPNAVKVQYSEAKPVTCKCGHTFCFSCGHEWHDPVNCKLLRRWIKKCNDDSETSNWIAANTKECPKCHVTVEKDGGCNHMVCKNSNCKMEYCWVCLGPWEPHGSSWYNCNRFDDGAAKQARDAQEKSRSALQRYLFYCNRYMNHMQSLKFENKLYASVKAKMEEMQQHNMSWIEVQFLKKAVDVLCLCRRTLMYTYVFAYYANKNNQVEIFEDNQRDLENATETLSEYLERELTADNIASIKQKVQDKYRYCEQRRIKLLDHCHEGNEKDSWDFNDI